MGQQWWHTTRQTTWYVIYLPDYWTKDISNITEANSFSEWTGPSLPDDIKTDSGVFLHLFPNNCIAHIVFQTNLHAIQRYDERRNVKPTAAKESKILWGVNILMGLKVILVALLLFSSEWSAIVIRCCRIILYISYYKQWFCNHCLC